MALSSLHLPKYRPQLYVSLSSEDDPKFLACCVLSENLLQFRRIRIYETQFTIQRLENSLNRKLCISGSILLLTVFIIHMSATYSRSYALYFLNTLYISLHLPRTFSETGYLQH
jgi:hypothetical protein